MFKSARINLHVSIQQVQVDFRKPAMNKQLPMITSFVLFLLLCASVTFWTLQLMKPAPRAVAASAATLAGDAPLEGATGLFGGSAVKVAMASNFQLKGVVVAGNSNESIAILAANGKPPVSTRIYGEVIPGVTVKEVHGQYVLLSEQGVIRRVDLQELSKNSMQLSPQNSQVAGSFSVPQQRIETPPPLPMPTQIAPAMPTTMIVPGQPPGAPMSPMPPTPDNTPSGMPGRQYGSTVVIPPGSEEGLRQQRNHASH